jgi:hypothetical protein
MLNSKSVSSVMNLTFQKRLCLTKSLSTSFPFFGVETISLLDTHFLTELLDDDCNDEEPLFVSSPALLCATELMQQQLCWEELDCVPKHLYHFLKYLLYHFQVEFQHYPCDAIDNMYSHLLPVRLGFPMMLYCNQTI